MGFVIFFLSLAFSLLFHIAVVVIVDKFTKTNVQFLTIVFGFIFLELIIIYANL